MKILRIYMKASTKRKGSLSFWQKYFNSSLSNYLLREAKKMGIEQVLWLRIEAGYLKGQKILYNSVEGAALDLPVCLEMIDEKDKLDGFLEKYKSELSDCRSILLDFEERQIK